MVKSFLKAELAKEVIKQKLQLGIYCLGCAVNFVIKKTETNRNEILQQARMPILFGMYLIVFLVLCGLWAVMVSVNSAAIATGTIISHSKIKTIQHQEGGIIKNILVKQGDNVRQGDVLVELIDIRSRSAYESVLNQYRTILATENRLTAERDNLDKVTWSELLNDNLSVSEVQKIIHTQENLFRSKKEIYRAQKQLIKLKIEQFNKQIEGLEAQKVSITKNLTVVTSRLQSVRQLHGKGFVQKDVILEMEMKEADHKSQLAFMVTEIAKTHHDITRAEIELINLDNQYTAQVLGELKEAEVNAASLREQFITQKDILDRVLIKSPIDGIINVINYHTIGGVINTAQPIMEIMPINDSLVVEAKIPSKNIYGVEVGLPAKIRFNSFQTKSIRSFNGKVTSVSPDVIQDKNAGMMDPMSGDSFYIARIEIDVNDIEKFSKAERLELHPGMCADIQIITGTRTLLRYILDPVIDAMSMRSKE